MDMKAQRTETSLKYMNSKGMLILNHNNQKLSNLSDGARPNDGASRDSHSYTDDQVSLARSSDQEGAVSLENNESSLSILSKYCDESIANSQFDPAHCEASLEMTLHQSSTESPDNDFDLTSDSEINLSELCDDNDDGSLGFPPGHILHLHQLKELQQQKCYHKSRFTLNPSILPSYFFCPLTQTIMRDPVLTPDGYIFERRAILRSLILEPCNPLTGNALSHEQLKDDILVRQKIDKQRIDAWARYSAHFQEEAGDSFLSNSHKTRKDRKRVSKVKRKKLIEKNERYFSGIKQESNDPIPALQSTYPIEQSPVLIDEKYIRYNQNDSLLKCNFPGIIIPSSDSDTLSRSNFTSSTAPVITAEYSHGWNAPLGVHRIICNPPGLVVTGDIYRRSGVVQRKILTISADLDDAKSFKNIKRKLTTGNKSVKSVDDSVPHESILQEYDVGAIQIPSSSIRSQQRNQIISQIHSTATQAVHVISPKRILKRTEKRNTRKVFNTTATLRYRDMILSPGSHVNIIETAIHGGRVRGKIMWEEEIPIEFEDDLLLQIEQYEEGRKECDVECNKLSKLLDEFGAFSVLNDSVTHEKNFNSKKERSRKVLHQKSNNPTASKHLPFTTELFSELPHHDYESEISTCGPLISTEKYSGWISLQWAENNKKCVGDNNINREQNCTLISTDEDNGPWSQPIPLGVYRIHGYNTRGIREDVNGAECNEVFLNDALKNDRNVTEVLVEGQCVEIIETRVVVMPQKVNDRRWTTQNKFSINGAHDFRCVRVVRARCMVPLLVPSLEIKTENMVRGMKSVDSLYQKKLKDGWITLSEDNELCLSGSCVTSATLLTLGAYIVVSSSGCVVTEGMNCDSKVKYNLASGSIIEVVTTRIEFEENDELVHCLCGRKNKHTIVAVRALIASGGHVTLFFYPISTSRSFDGCCFCGNSLKRTIAEPVLCGMYRITNPDGVYLTREISSQTQNITKLEENMVVKVVETTVEDGHIWGRVQVDLSDCYNVVENSEEKEIDGWINLVQPPSIISAELIKEC